MLSSLMPVIVLVSPLPFICGEMGNVTLIKEAPGLLEIRDFVWAHQHCACQGCQRISEPQLSTNPGKAPSAARWRSLRHWLVDGQLWSILGRSHTPSESCWRYSLMSQGERSLWAHWPPKIMYYNWSRQRHTNTKHWKLSIQLEKASPPLDWTTRNE